MCIYTYRIYKDLLKFNTSLKIIPEKIKNFLIDGFIDLYLSNPLVFFISKSELEEIMIKASLEDITVVDFIGLILGLGTRPS
jgi:hypothetical protein